MAVARSDLITTLDEARHYYRATLVGVRRVTCYGKKISVFFDFDATHMYSEGLVDGQVPLGATVVTQQIGVAVSEVRVFSLKRARHMDYVLPAISLFTLSIVGQGAKGRETKVLHGPRLPSGEYMRVVLRPARDKTWGCKSAFPINHATYMQAWNSKRAKFPP